MSRSYSNDVSPDRSTLRTVFRDTLRSRAISLIVLPLRKCSRRIRPIVSTVSIPSPPASNQSEQRIRPNGRGSILDADNPAQGVKIARRNTSTLEDRLGADCRLVGRDGTTRMDVPQLRFRELGSPKKSSKPWRESYWELT